MAFISNYIYLYEKGYFDVANIEKWVLHTWSLSVEWQFYIIYPLVVWGLAKCHQKVIKPSLLILTIISFAACVYLSFKQPSQAFYGLGTRVWEMLLGGMAYLYPLNIKRPSISTSLAGIGLTMIVGTCIFIAAKVKWPGYVALIPTLGTYLVIQARASRHRLLSHPLMQFTGKISYSLYLWHWPILVGFYYVGFSESYLILGIVLSFMMAYLSYTYIESIKFKKPDPSWINLLKTKPLYLCLSLCLIGYFIMKSHGAFWHYSPIVQKLHHQTSKMHLFQGGCKVESEKDLDKPCDKPISAILLGDSHAMVIAEELSQAIDSEHQLLNLSISSCKLIAGLYDDNHACAKHLQLVLKALERYPHQPIIFHNRVSDILLGPNETVGVPTRGFQLETRDHHVSQSQAYRKRIVESYEKMLCDLAEQHDVYFLEQTPELKRSVPLSTIRSILLSKENLRVKIPIAEYNQRHQLFYQIAEHVTQNCNVNFVRTKHLFCDDAFCYGDKNNNAIYYDDDHLSRYGASLFAPIFKAIMAPYIDKNPKLEG